MLNFPFPLSRWERLRRAVVTWADRTFHSITPPKALHMQEECLELYDALIDDSVDPAERKRRIAKELADIFIIGMHVAHCEDIDLLDAIKTKFEIVKVREWQAPDEHGVIRHKEGT